MANIGSVQTDQADQLLALCERAVREDGADALVIAGAWPTVSVKLCVALVPTPLLATMLSGKVPLCSGVPLSTPALLSVTPVGNALVVLKLAAG